VLYLSSLVQRVRHSSSGIEHSTPSSTRRPTPTTQATAQHYAPASSLSRLSNTAPQSSPNHPRRAGIGGDRTQSARWGSEPREGRDAGLAGRGVVVVEQGDLELECDGS
jgi:hypothetical protein